jgi:rhodanese-related sulfurtransferase
MIDVRCVHSEATWCPLQSALINVSIFWFLLSGFPCSADEHWTGWGRSGKDSYCGIYCLYAAAKVLGKDIDSRELIDPNYVGSHEGSSLAELKKAAEDHGLYAVPVGKLTTRELRQSPYRIILHVKSASDRKRYDHYVLFLGTKSRQARLYDPPNPVKLVPFYELAPRWDGTGLIVAPRPIDLGAVFGRARKRFIMYAAIAISVILGVRWGRQRCLASAGKMTRRRLLRLSIAQGVGFTISALLFGMLYNFVNDEGFLANPKATASVQQAYLGSFIPRINERQAGRLLDTDAVFIDARFARDFKAGHLEGAINIPVDANEAERQNTMTDISKYAHIIVYCQSTKCKFAEIVAMKLNSDGFSNISLFEGGWRLLTAKNDK